jgi:hypothetical protein
MDLPIYHPYTDVNFLFYEKQFTTISTCLENISIRNSLGDLASGVSRATGPHQLMFPYDPRLRCFTLDQSQEWGRGQIPQPC